MASSPWQAQEALEVMDQKALIGERVKLFEDNKALLDKAAAEKRHLTGEEQQQWDARDAKITEIRGTLDRLEKQAAEEKLLSESRGRQTETEIRPTGDPDAIADRDRDLAFRAWALGPRNIRHASESMRVASRKLGLDVQASELDGFRSPEQRSAILELRALSGGNTSAGGYSVPDEMMKAFVEVQKWHGRVENLATVLNTTGGNPLPIPTINDTSNTGEIVAEAGAVVTTADMSFGQIVLNGYKYSSKAILVSVELLMDSSVNLPQYLGRALGTRIARIKNTHYTTGDDSDKPNGVVTAASAGRTATATNAFILDDVIDLIHSVDKAYRDRPSSAFMMHDTIASTVRKFKDSQNQYIWQVGAQSGQPDRLFGYPVEINNDMASTQTTSAKIMLFGDFNAYYVRNAGAVTFARADELRLLNHQVVFVAFQRSDGDLPDTTAVRRLNNATS